MLRFPHTFRAGLRKQSPDRAEGSRDHFFVQHLYRSSLPESHLRAFSAHAFFFAATNNSLFTIFPPSSTTYNRLTSRFFRVSTAPDGQRISTASTFFASPSPK